LVDRPPNDALAFKINHFTVSWPVNLRIPRIVNEALHLPKFKSIIDRQRVNLGLFDQARRLRGRARCHPGQGER
jgi:hypothetical protein